MSEGFPEREVARYESVDASACEVGQGDITRERLNNPALRQLIGRLSANRDVVRGDWVAPPSAAEPGTSRGRNTFRIDPAVARRPRSP
jgi:hypothetical protein